MNLEPRPPWLADIEEAVTPLKKRIAKLSAQVKKLKKKPAQVGKGCREIAIL